MGVIIPDIDMPKNCETCKFSSYHDGDDYCDLYKIMHGYAWRAKDVKWDNDCPLKSTDEMIAEIEEQYAKFKLKTSPLSIFNIIHKYTDKEQTDE